MKNPLAYAFLPFTESLVDELWSNFVLTLREPPQAVSFIPAMDGVFVVWRETSRPFLHRIRCGYLSEEARTIKAFENYTHSLQQSH